MKSHEIYISHRSAFRKHFTVDYRRHRHSLPYLCLCLSNVSDSLFQKTHETKILPGVLKIIMANKNWQNEFVKYSLTDDQVEVMRDALNEVEDPFNLVVDLVQDGYRVNFKFLEEREACNVILIPVSEKSKNAGLMLSAFHADPLKALFEVWFVHFSVSDKDWASTNQKRSVWW